MDRENQSSHYTVLARRFRPQTFAEVVGQAHVAQALRNAIAGGRVAHAYLFTGARGVGKTSMARIFAKALNCPNIVDGNPCNACEICEGIASGHDVDVLEIDGASNRRIDDIRLLRSNVGVKSMRTKYKIYIIDEVHMLTNEAFNALLKTLEEPPPNVKFVFCTTEPNKVPETILSRCQRFDFTAIETQKIVERLHEIAVADGYEVEPAALEIVARRADGSMRDSQSLFDQLLAYGGHLLSAADVHRLLGTASDERLIEMADGLTARQSDRVLELFDRALAEGVQLGEIVDQLLDYFRDLMVIAAGAESTELQSVAPTHRTELAEQGRRWGLPTIVTAMQILAETKTQMQRSGHGRALAELALVRLTLLEATIDLAALVEELRTRGGVPSAPTTAVSQPRPRPSIVNGPSAIDPPNMQRRADVGTEPPAGQPDDRILKSPPQNVAVEERLVDPATELQSGSGKNLLSQLIARLDVKSLLRRALDQALSVAISGPNQLEICFPVGYHFEMNLCRTPIELPRLEKMAGELLGCPVRITFSTAAEGSGVIRPSPSERGHGQPDPSQQGQNGPKAAGGGHLMTGPGSVGGSVEVNHPYVEMARTTFGAAVVRVEKLASPHRDPATGEEGEGIGE